MPVIFLDVLNFISKGLGNCSLPQAMSQLSKARCFFVITDGHADSLLLANEDNQFFTSGNAGIQ